MIRQRILLFMVFLFVCITLACNSSRMTLVDFSSLPTITEVEFEGIPWYLDWSPDDSQLLITGWYDGELRIIVLDLTTGMISVLFTFIGEHSDRNDDPAWVVQLDGADWSPDGMQVVFAKSEPLLSEGFLGQGVWIIDVPSGETRLLTRTGESPVWSTNGQYIFTVGCDQMPSSDGLPICQLDASTGELTFLYTVKPKVGEFGDVMNPPLALSANDRFLATKVHSHIYVLDTQSGETRRLEPAIWKLGTWASKGDILVFVGPPKGREDLVGLYLINADGTCLTSVLETKGTRLSARFATWSHDGSKIAFVYDDRIYFLNTVETVSEDVLKGRLSCP